MMERLRPLGFAIALVLGALIGAGCSGEAQMSLNTAPPPPPPPAAAPTDDDGDGIADPDDKCPKDKEDGQPPDPKDGCPNDDPDNDNVKGAADKCPNEPETVNGFEDDDGCPDKKPQIEIKAGELKINDKILFKTNSAEIDERSNQLIENIANTIKQHPEINYIEIAGHADSRGTAANNKNLTQRRSKAVLDAMVKLGVEAPRLRNMGYGALCPLDTAETEEAWEKNRRVEFKILRNNGKDTAPPGDWGGCDGAKAAGMKAEPIPANAPKTEAAAKK